MSENVRDYSLEAFPDAAVHLRQALDLNQRRIALSKGLSGMELRAFFRIAQSGSITPKVLAGQLSVTTGATTGIASRLVNADLIHRAERPNDRRSIHLELTEHGHTVMDEINSDFKTMVSAATRDVSAADLELTTQAIVTITRGIYVALGQTADGAESTSP